MNRKIWIFGVVCFCLMSAAVIAIITIQSNEDLKNNLKGLDRCPLTAEDVRIFSYEGKKYFITDSRVKKEENISIAAYFNKLAAVRENGELICQQSFDKLDLNAFRKEIGRAEGEIYCLSFLNIYRFKNDSSCLAVCVNGEYFKAMPADEVQNEADKMNIAKLSDDSRVEYKFDV